MDDTRSLSNSAASAPAEADPFASWGRALAALAAALRAYAREVGEAGARALGARWAAALRAAAEPGPPAGAAGEPGPPAGAAGLAGRMAAGDGLEEAARHLGGASEVLLSPDVRAAVAAGMSRTFSENLRGLTREVAAATAAATAAARAALAAAAAEGASLAAGLSAAAVAEAYSAPQERPRGAVATELYVGALACLRSPEARALLEESRGGALGGGADTRAAAAADAAALSEYHPCQAMCYVPAFAPRPGAGDPGAPAFGLAFPQARLAVTYDLGPLVDRRRALEYGPLAPATSGLNYRLVERLRTIRAAPAPAPPPGAAAAAPPAPRPGTVAGAILVTTAPGVTWEFGPGPPAEGGAPAEGGVWAPFAGGQPRAALYAEAAAAVILDQLRAEQGAGWGGLLPRYEAAVRDGAVADPPANPDALVDALAAEFEKAYDAAPPEDLPAFRALAVPQAPGPRDYISAAVARLAGDALGARLRAHLAEPRPRVPYAAFEREARISQAVLVADVAQDLWRRLREAYWGDGEAFVPDPVRRKVLLLRHFRRLAAAAAAAAPVHLAPPSLKLWAAGGSR